jgi:hypothetical protein
VLFFFGFCSVFLRMPVHKKYAGSDVGRRGAIWRSPKYIMPVI